MPEPTDQDPTTAGDERDPLSTDDGLAEAAQTMPAVDESRRDDETADDTAAPIGQPELDLAADGTDPVADLAKPGEGEA